MVLYPHVEPQTNFIYDGKPLVRSVKIRLENIWYDLIYCQSLYLILQVTIKALLCSKACLIDLAPVPPWCLLPRAFICHEYMSHITPLSRCKGNHEQWFRLHIHETVPRTFHLLLTYQNSDNTCVNHFFVM
jgi:hypothetical protein